MRWREQHVPPHSSRPSYIGIHDCCIPQLFQSGSRFQYQRHYKQLDSLLIPAHEINDDHFKNTHSLHNAATETSSEVETLVHPPICLINPVTKAKAPLRLVSHLMPSSHQLLWPFSLDGNHPEEQGLKQCIASSAHIRTRAWWESSRRTRIETYKAML
jgi:hypothetical protein